MIAYCDRKDGTIHFAERKPRGGLMVAQHGSHDVLKTVLRQSGAWDCRAHRDGKPIGETMLSVPWLATAKFPEDEEEYVQRFAQKVQERLHALVT